MALKIDLKSLFTERIVTGLKHSSITKPSKWAEMYRQLSDGPWNFRDFLEYCNYFLRSSFSITPQSFRIASSVFIVFSWKEI